MQFTPHLCCRIGQRSGVCDQTGMLVVLHLIESLEDLEDVQRVYSNADFSDEAVESYGG